jgi:hypothetical protein
MVFAHLGKKSSFGALVAFDVTHGFLQPFPHIVLFKIVKDTLNVRLIHAKQHLALVDCSI